MKMLPMALAALLCGSAANADTLFDHANGIAVDAQGRVTRFEALLVNDSGLIEKVLRKGEPRPTTTTVVDLGGRHLLPGIIDAHGHVMGLGFGAIQLDLTGTTSLADLQQRLKDYAAAHPDYPWIVGRGWNQELWAEKRFPTAPDIDSVIVDRPVWLTRVDGHAAVANQAAMRAANVTAATKAPAGGEIIDGLFVDAAQEMVEKAIPEPTPAMRDRALAEAQAAMLAVGLVGAADMGTSAADWAGFRRAGEAGTLKVRIISYAGGLEAWRAINRGSPTGAMYGERLRLVGTKLYTDGALGSRGAWLKAPYHDRPDTRGLQFLKDEELLAQVREVASGDGQLAIHAIGDAANAQVIAAYEKVGFRDRRPRIEHFQIADPKDIPRLKPAGIIASMQPTHQTSDRTMAEARLGPNRLDGAYAWRTVLNLGIPLAFGSDFPVESPNPFPGLSAAISRLDMNGQPPGGWLPKQRISLGEALHAFTRGAAYAGLAERTLGALEPGKFADFIIVDRDVSTADAQSLARTKVLETWIAGEKVWAAEPSASQPGERGQ